MAASAPRFDGVKRGTAISKAPPVRAQLDLEDDRIMIDIETDMAMYSRMQTQANKQPRSASFLALEGRTLGPLIVLLLLACYFLASPLLSPAIHQYMFRILH